MESVTFNNDDSLKSKNISKVSLFNFTTNILAICSYLIVIISALIRFIPINSHSWFDLGMGKYIGIASIFAIYFIVLKNYFAAFFISIFASFFVFHEIIIFYDNYAIELGKELGDTGLFRSIPGIFENICNIKLGAFWAIIGSLLSLMFVTLSWISHTIKVNHE